MIRSFKDTGTRDVYDGVRSKAARKTCPETIWRVAQRKLDYLDAAARLTDLKEPPGNHLEALKGDRAGQHSIRINDQYRICFFWDGDGASNVEITDYH
jgi:toxin HigB-1